METMPRLNFPTGSLLAALLGDAAPMDLRRAARRLRAEGAPALALDDDIAGLARGLGGAEVSHSPGVLDVLPPLFWLEAPRPEGAGIEGWIVERKGDGLAAQGFGIALAANALPEGGWRGALRFSAPGPEEEAPARLLRGMVTAAALPQMMAQMGESSPVALLPAEAPGADAALLRGLRLAVVMAPDSVPG